MHSFKPTAYEILKENLRYPAEFALEICRLFERGEDDKALEKLRDAQIPRLYPREYLAILACI